MSNPLEVFCCSDHKDRELLKELTIHLSPLQKVGWITIWSILNLSPIVEWEKEFHQHLEGADLILLLISPDFLASDYCTSALMRRALERHEQGSAVALPILLRPTHWINEPFARLPILPTNGFPITQWPDRDAAFVDIARRIRQVVVKLQAQ